MFNLTSLTSSYTDVVSAEIHFYKRRKVRYNERAELALTVHEVAGGSTQARGHVTVAMSSYGWQHVDISDIIQSCLKENPFQILNIALSFELNKPHDNLKTLDLKRFMHRHSVPYLIIYSNDTTDNDVEEIEDLSKHHKTVDVIPPEVLGTDSVLPASHSRKRRSLSNNHVDFPVYQSRAQSFSILTNEIPENPEDYNKPYPINPRKLQTHPGMLQTRKESRHKITDPRIIPLPGEYSSKKKRRRDKKRNRRKKGKQSNQLELPREWEDLRQRAAQEGTDGTCGRKKLIVDFSDIGWGEWIISPKSFKAHYCAGTCTFPLTKVTTTVTIKPAP